MRTSLWVSIDHDLAVTPEQLLEQVRRMLRPLGPDVRLHYVLPSADDVKAIRAERGLDREANSG